MTEVWETAPGKCFLNGPLNTFMDVWGFSAGMFQFFTFVVYKPKMLGNYTLDYVDNYLTIKYCQVNLVSTFVFTFASSSINVGQLRKE